MFLGNAIVSHRLEIVQVHICFPKQLNSKRNVD